jgi:Zn-dependent protease
MKPTVRIGRIFGIEVGVHWSVLIIAGLLAVGLAGGERDVAVWAVAIVAVGLFFASLLAHELAHSVVARRNGMQVTGITLWLLGGMAQLGGPMPSARAELKVAAAGPATSVLLGIGFLLAAIAGAASGLLSSLPVSALAWLAFVNVVLAVFNLIPAAPLDGGRILAGFLWARHGDRTRAEITATRAGQVVGWAFIGLGVVGIFVDVPFVSLWTALLGWFIVTAATAEQRHARLTGGLGELRVRDVMSPVPETVRGWMTVEAFADEAGARPPSHHVLPVEDWSGGIAGVVTLDALRAVAIPERGTTRVLDVAVPIASVITASPDERLVDLVSRPTAGTLPFVLVFAEEALVGVLTAADLTFSAGSRRPGRSQPAGNENGVSQAGL